MINGNNKNRNVNKNIVGYLRIETKKLNTGNVTEIMVKNIRQLLSLFQERKRFCSQNTIYCGENAEAL